MRQQAEHEQIEHGHNDEDRLHEHGGRELKVHGVRLAPCRLKAEGPLHGYDERDAQYIFILRTD